MCTPSGEEIYTETINIVVTATSRNKYAEASDEITKSCTVIGACSSELLDLAESPFAIILTG